MQSYSRHSYKTTPDEKVFFVEHDYEFIQMGSRKGYMTEYFSKRYQKPYYSCWNL